LHRCHWGDLRQYYLRPAHRLRRLPTLLVLPSRPGSRRGRMLPALRIGRGADHHGRRRGPAVAACGRCGHGASVAGVIAPGRSKQGSTGTAHTTRHTDTQKWLEGGCERIRLHTSPRHAGSSATLMTPATCRTSAVVAPNTSTARPSCSWVQRAERPRGRLRVSPTARYHPPASPCRSVSPHRVPHGRSRCRRLA
jgi:hypothetical protein